MIKRPILHIAALMLAGSLAVSAARADDKDVTLAQTLKVGDTFRMKAVISFTAAGMDGTVEEIAKSVVREVKKNGDIVFVTTQEKSHVSVAGQEQDSPAAPPVRETHNKLGLLTDLQVEIGVGSPFTAEIMKLMNMTSTFVFPDKPVKAGATWTTEADNPAVKGKKLSLKETFVAVDKVDGVDLWKVKQSGAPENGADNGKMAFDVTFWLNPADGQIVKAEGSWKDVPTQFGQMSYTMKATRLKPSDTKPDATPAKP